MSMLPNALHDVLETARIKQLPKGQILLYQDDVPTEAHIIKSGAIKIYDIDDDGNEKILHILGKLGLLPLAFFSPQPVAVNWFYATLSDTEVYVLPIDDLKRAMYENNELSMSLMYIFWSDVHELLVRLSSFGKTNVEGKVVAVLKFLLEHHSVPVKQQWYKVTFPVTHQLIADIAGITRESTTVIMKELSDQKVIKNGKQSNLEINKTKLHAL